MAGASMDKAGLHRKKSFSILPSPAGMSLTKFSLAGNNDVIYKLFPPRESLAGDGNNEKLFFTVYDTPLIQGTDTLQRHNTENSK